MARAIAFLDILGFKNLLQTEDLSGLAERYEAAIAETEKLNAKKVSSSATFSFLPNHEPGQPWCYRRIFSDSIFLIALDDSAESCLKLLFYTRVLFVWMLVKKLPVRGAVAAGDLYHSPDTGTTLGAALTEAYLLEKNQEWAGVCIGDSVWTAYPELFAQVKDPTGPLQYCFIPYDIPWKKKADGSPDGMESAHFAINWRFNTVVETGDMDLLTRARIDQVPSKFENTLRYLELVRASGARFWGDGSDKPAEWGTVWLGPSKPPFKDGNTK
ncbi:hypothetical protein [Lysobacter claricitrinus]|uniref:hypothetical protein n=1 Tax=Lysobacter claricitrinus TaxID=3367728 RepID=UPI0037DA819A